MEKFKYRAQETSKTINMQNLEPIIKAYHKLITEQLGQKDKFYLDDFKNPLLVLRQTGKILFREDAAAALNKFFSLSAQPEEMKLLLCSTGLLKKFPIWIYQNYFIELGYAGCRCGIWDKRLPVFESPGFKEDQCGFVFLTYQLFIDMKKNANFRFNLIFDLENQNIIKLKSCCILAPGGTKSWADPLIPYYEILFNFNGKTPFSWEDLLKNCREEFLKRKQRLKKVYSIETLNQSVSYQQPL